MCLSKSIVQAYIDTELAIEAMVSTRVHIEACSKCKLIVNEAITEQQMVSSALAHEMELPVPTVRLRARIDSASNACQTIRLSDKSSASIIHVTAVRHFDPLKLAALTSEMGNKEPELGAVV